MHGTLLLTMTHTGGGGIFLWPNGPESWVAIAVRRRLLTSHLDPLALRRLAPHTSVASRKR